MKKKPPAKDVIVSLRVIPPPDPECPKCHHQPIEDLYPAVPWWCSCPNCGYMWSTAPSPVTGPKR